MALRKDVKARIFKTHTCLFLPYYRFERQVRSHVIHVDMKTSEYKRKNARQRIQPVRLYALEGKTWWWYRGEFYTETEGYSPEEVKLLLWEKDERRRRKFERLRKATAGTARAKSARHERIPEEVRMLVWRRDGGRCVKCGSTEDLEFDHIIPIAKGGSNTEKNVQLLCAKCNREKSNHI